MDSPIYSQAKDQFQVETRPRNVNTNAENITEVNDHSNRFYSGFMLSFFPASVTIVTEYSNHGDRCKHGNMTRQNTLLLLNTFLIFMYVFSTKIAPF